MRISGDDANWIQNTQIHFSIFYLHMKNKNYQTVGTVPKSTTSTVEGGTIDKPNTNTWPLTFLAW
jgi:hypothetical protein